VVLSNNLLGLDIQRFGFPYPTFKMELMPNPNRLSVIYCKLKTLDIGWGNLTHVTLDSVELHECIDLIQRAPLLESLSLDYCEESDFQD
jgi:hypothetical protein